MHYDINMIGDFCKRNNSFLIVDIISTFLCDPFDMAEISVSVMITSSQKALAYTPGIAIMVFILLSLERIGRLSVVVSILT